MNGKELLAKHLDKLLVAGVTGGFIGYYRTRLTPGVPPRTWDDVDVSPYELGMEYGTVFGVNLPKNKVKICDLVWDKDISKWTSPGKFRAKYGPGVKSRGTAYVVSGVAGSKPTIATPHFGPPPRDSKYIQLNQ